MRGGFSRTLPVLLLAFGAAVAAAQDAPPEKRPPEGTWIINLPSADVPAPGNLSLLFSHRFSQDVPDSNFDSLFSFDSPASIGIGLGYVPVRNLQLWLQRSSYLTASTSSLPATARQPCGPLVFSLQAGVDWRTEQGASFDLQPDYSRNGVLGQAILAFSVGDRLRITAVPTWVSETSGQPLHPATRPVSQSLQHPSRRLRRPDALRQSPGGGRGASKPGRLDRRRLDRGGRKDRPPASFRVYGREPAPDDHGPVRRAEFRRFLTPRLLPGLQPRPPVEAPIARRYPLAAAVGRRRVSPPRSRRSPTLLDITARRAAGGPPLQGLGRLVAATDDRAAARAARRSPGRSLRRPGRDGGRDPHAPRRATLDGGRLRGVSDAARSAYDLLRVRGQSPRDGLRRPDRVTEAGPSDDLRGRALELSRVHGPSRAQGGAMVRPAADTSRGPRAARCPLAGELLPGGPWIAQRAQRLVAGR